MLGRFNWIESKEFECFNRSSCVLATDALDSEDGEFPTWSLTTRLADNSSCAAPLTGVLKTVCVQRTLVPATHSFRPVLTAAEALEQQRIAEQEAREREARLQRAMEKLRVEAPRDPERLLKEPARLQAEAYRDPLVCVTRGPHAGFDEKRLMSDARYKLAAALQAAGLFDTKAGHEALAQVRAPKPAQPHFVSTVFDGYPA